MKWVGMYFFGFVLFLAGALAALWKLGWLAQIGGTWVAIGLVTLLGIGVMFAVANSGTKEHIQIKRE